MIRAQRERMIVEGAAQGARAERVAGHAERADQSAGVGRSEWVGAQRCTGIKAAAVIVVMVWCCGLSLCSGSGVRVPENPPCPLAFLLSLNFFFLGESYGDRES